MNHILSCGVSDAEMAELSSSRPVVQHTDVNGAVEKLAALNRRHAAIPASLYRTLAKDIHHDSPTILAAVMRIDRHTPPANLARLLGTFSPESASIAFRMVDDVSLSACVRWLGILQHPHTAPFGPPLDVHMGVDDLRMTMYQWHTLARPCVA